MAGKPSDFGIFYTPLKFVSDRLRMTTATASVLRLTLVISLIANISSTPVDNGISGDPEIECSADSILINFNTRNPFEGHVFVKGHYSEPGCRTDATNSRAASISVPFSSCGVRRQRSANPLGLFVTATVIISFHPQFLTKVDRAYNVRCFYMEADKTVNSQLEVSMLTTQLLTMNIPMPVCKYEVLANGPTGNKVTYAKIGDHVYHKWSCATETRLNPSGSPSNASSGGEIFCMTVHTCFVDDGQGQKVQLLDENGCAMDKYLLNKIDYQGDLVGGQESHVYKFADKPSLFYNCQIRLTLKESGKCNRSADACLAPIRGKRDLQTTTVSTDGQEVDVYSPTIILFDEALDQSVVGSDPSLDRRNTHQSYQSATKSTEGICLSTLSFGLIISAAAIILLSAVVILSVFCLRSNNFSLKP